MVEPGSCGVSPVFAWAGKLVGAEWSEQDIEKICACSADPGTRYVRALKVVDWVLSNGFAVTEVFRAPRLEVKISKEEADRLDQEADEYDQLTTAVRAYPNYRYQESRRYPATLKHNVRSNPLLVAIGDGEQSIMVGMAGSFQKGVTAVYNPAKPQLGWQNLDKAIGKVVKEVQRSNWPAFVLHS